MAHNNAAPFPRQLRRHHWLASLFWRRRYFWPVLIFWPIATASLAATLLTPLFGPPASFPWNIGQGITSIGPVNTGVDLSDILSVSLLVGVLMLCLSIYLVSWAQTVAARPRYLILILGMLLLTVLAARVTLPAWSGWAYAFPLAATAMTIAALLDVQLGLVVGLILAFLVGAGVGASIELTLIYAAGAAIGAMGMRRVNRLRRFGTVGLSVGLVSLPLIGAFHFMSDPQANQIGHLAALCLIGLVGGELSAIMALSLYSFLGSLFGITTMLQLFDTSRPNHPLLHRLLLEAPGTYHHSIVVAAMTERAAQDIGADSLLARVGSYYHDIGKIVHPQVFVENQFNGRNVHDQLTPISSAKLIRAHVSQGLRLAAKHRLPARVRDCIAEHHGTLRMEFFYDKACRLAAEQGQDAPSELAFRYKGPRPRSKETAILMLADAVEPMVRAGQAGHTPEEMDVAIRQITQDRLADGQLSDCNLTTQELDTIRRAFLSTLRGMFHQRIIYPELRADTDTGELELERIEEIITESPYTEPPYEQPAFPNEPIKQVS